jgi:hypothetical protein
MPKKLLLYTLAFLGMTGITCAPRDDNPPPKPGPNPGEVKKTPPIQPKVLAELPQSFKERLDAARQHIRQRSIPTTHSFWTVFHGILGVGPENAMLFDMESGNKIKAIDHVCNGGVWRNEPMRGLEFREHRDGSVEVVTRPGSGTFQGHQDQFIAEMAQWGLPRDKVFVVKGKKHTFDDFLRYSRNKASVSPEENQELSWAIIIVGQYYGTDHRWTNSRKEEMTLEEMVQYEVGQPIDTAACGGTHRLFGLTWVYHLHRQNGGKKEGVWLKTVEHLDKYKKLARKFQNGDGTFSTKYVSEPGNDIDPELRINTSGHVFEWLALALSDEEIRLNWMQDAAQALIRLILDNSDRSINGGALYHAAHGLEIYRTRLFGPADDHPPLIPPPPKD